MTKAVFNGNGNLPGGFPDTNGTVNAFAGLSFDNSTDYATAAISALPPAVGIVPLPTAEVAGHAVAHVTEAPAASSPPLDLFALGEFVPPSVPAGGNSGTEIVAATEAAGYNVAFVNVTPDGTGGYTVASAGFPTGAVGLHSSSQPNARSSSPLPRGAHGGDTFNESLPLRSPASDYVAFNFFKSPANSHVTNFSLVGFPYTTVNNAKPVFTSPAAKGAVTLENVKVLGWNSDSILLSFGASIDLNNNDAAGGGGDIVISTENMTMNAGSLPANTSFSTTGAHPVINGTTVPCFAAGTRLATPDGDIAVEHLQPGDAVLNHEGQAETITWIGTRTVACHAHPRPEKVWPVRVRRHAFGPGLPKRDLILSPDHAVFVQGVLIPVCELINGSSVVQERVHAIRYLHVECALHTILLAEGMPAESLLDLGDHRQFENGEAPISLHADFTALAWEASCVPLKLHGPEVEAARALLLRQMQVAA